MAVQHLFVYSASVDGAAVAAGSPYGCGSLPDAIDLCSYGDVSATALATLARTRSDAGVIDGVGNLARTPVVLFLGSNDWMVYPQVMNATGEQLRAFGAAVVDVYNTSAAHVWPLDRTGCACGACASFWAYDDYDGDDCCDVNNCEYDLSGDMLRRAYPGLRPRVPARKNTAGGTDLWWVNQTKYVPPRTGNDTWVATGMREWGMMYVPTGWCGGDAACRVHVHYHGCGAGSWAERTEWNSEVDLNEYAEANGIVVIYPQAALLPGDQADCWNWNWEDTDPHYDTYSSVQLRTVAALVEDVPGIVRRGGGAGPPPCECSPTYPYCFEHDAYCYKSADSYDSSSAVCPGHCTSSYAPPLPPHAA